jgi:tetratricopeptide (TPR) repeat protein
MERRLLAGERRMRAAIHASLLLSAVLAAAPELVGAADREAERLAAAAVALCGRADRVPGDERPPVLRRGLKLAERALARDETVARAHFAVFCTLGKLVELQGIGWRTLGSVRRVRTAIERAVTLAPDDVDALVGRGALLLRLPRLLGGDAREAEVCLRRALQIDPWHASGRRYLAQLLGSGAAPAPTALSSASHDE